MPVLSAILNDVKAEGSVYFCDILTPPWNMDFLNKQNGSFHCVRRGDCVIEIGGERKVLHAGDIAIILQGTDHILTNSTPDGITSEDTETLLMCGYFRFDHELRHPLIESFPPLVVLRKEDIKNNIWLNMLLESLVEETQTQAPGASLILNRQTETLLILFIRQLLQSGSLNGPFVQALYDPKSSLALKHLHESPEKHWTLDNLAREVGLSRAAMAARFQKYVGLPMFSYLTDIRMTKACKYLKETNKSISTIAPLVGYESDVSFIRAFQKKLLVSPFKYRKKHLEAQ